MKFKTKKLEKQHTKDFDCGKDLLNNYLKKQASQDVRKKLTACFVLLEKTDELDKVIGYYTLSNLSISNELIPEKFRKKFPKSYKEIPVTLLGRLAIDKSQQGRGLGKLLLIEALCRSSFTANEVASFAVVVDPIDEEAVMFYENYGFILIPDSKKMLLPMETLNYLFSELFRD